MIEKKLKDLVGGSFSFAYIFGKTSRDEQYRSPAECGHDADYAGIDKPCGIKVHDYSGGIEEYASD